MILSEQKKKSLHASAPNLTTSRGAEGDLDDSRTEQSEDYSSSYYGELEDDVSDDDESLEKKSKSKKIYFDTEKSEGIRRRSLFRLFNSSFSCIFSYFFSVWELLSLLCSPILSLRTGYFFRVFSEALCFLTSFCYNRLVFSLLQLNSEPPNGE